VSFLLNSFSLTYFKILNPVNANGWYPSQKLSRREALRGFTADAAFASFEEDQLGRIAVGGLADFLILDRDVLDPTNCSDDQILQTEVLGTFLGGELVYR
jgi:predicted amidohydrolase YtcJ